MFRNGFLRPLNYNGNQESYHFVVDLMRSMLPHRFKVAVLTMALLTFSQGHAQLGPKDPADLKPTDLKRVKVGDIAPDFTLEDMDGKPITLSNFRNKIKVVLVFYRGHW